MELADGTLFILQAADNDDCRRVLQPLLEPWRHGRARMDDQRGSGPMLADETWVSPISPLFYQTSITVRPDGVGFFRPTRMTRRCLRHVQVSTGPAYADVNRHSPMTISRGCPYPAVSDFLPTLTAAHFQRSLATGVDRCGRILSYEVLQIGACARDQQLSFRETQWPA